MIGFFQILAGLAAVAMLFGDKLKTLAFPSSPDARLDHLKEETGHLVDIATHLEANGRKEEAKLAISLIPVLVEINNQKIINPVDPVPAGGRRA